VQRHLHLAPPGTGDERHALDQGTDRLRRLAPILRVPQGRPLAARS